MTRHRNAAAALVGQLQSAGVEQLFTLSGNQILSVFDACLEAGPRLVHVRHEASAVHMADAWGRLTSRPGVALLTAGPGHANGLSALYVALQAESPLLLLSGHSPASDLSRGGFQQMPQAELARPLAKASWTVEDPGQVGPAVAEGLRLAAAGRPGPVHLSLPGDLLEGEAATPGQDPPWKRDDPPPRAPDLQPMLAALLAAARPLVLGGPAMLRPAARETVEGLRRASGLPVVCTESPRGLNDPSLGALTEVAARADVVLLLGKKLDWSLRFGGRDAFDASCRFLQIDADSAELERSRRALGDPHRLTLALQMDPLEAARRLAELAESPARPSAWADEVRAAVAYRPAAWQQLARLAPTDARQAAGDAEPLHPVQLCAALRRWMTGDAVFISDGGEFGQWAQATLSAPHRVINGPSGAIGGSIPFALAARIAFPHGRVLATLGDGTFGFHAMEFDTAARYGLPFVAVVGNDARWNAEYQLQLKHYGAERTIGCELLPSRYDQVVAALGGHGEFVTGPAELEPALERAFASNLPSCVNVLIQPEPAPVVRRG